MSRYLLYDNTMVKLNETYGTLENISDFKAQGYNKYLHSKRLYDKQEKLRRPRIKIQIVL